MIDCTVAPIKSIQRNYPQMGVFRLDFPTKITWAPALPVADIQYSVFDAAIAPCLSDFRFVDKFM